MIKLRIKTWMRHVAHVERREMHKKNVLGKPVGKRTLSSHRCSWEDNVRTNPREIGWENVHYINLDQNRDQ
jgi:hypothetical protein